MRARRRAYVSGWVRTEHAGKPVVVIGNLTVGGTGKTPLTIWLARQLTAAGLRVGIVSGGYGRSGGGRPLAVRGDSGWAQVGEDPPLPPRPPPGAAAVAAHRAP